MFSTVTQSNHIPFTSTKIGHDRGIHDQASLEISFRLCKTTPFPSVSIKAWAGLSGAGGLSLPMSPGGSKNLVQRWRAHAGNKMKVTDRHNI